jgi:hypothetical protein
MNFPIYEFIEKYKDLLFHAQRTENVELCLLYEGALEALVRLEREGKANEENVSEEI